MLPWYVKVGTVVVVIWFGIVTVGVSVSIHAEQRIAAVREPTRPTDVPTLPLP